MDARFAISECILTALFGCQICNLWVYSDSSFWMPDLQFLSVPWQVFRKNWNYKKNAISWKPERFEQSHLDVRFASYECTMTAPRLYCLEFQVRLTIFMFFFEKIEKIIKSPYFENQKNLSSHTWTLDLHLMSVPWQHPTIKFRISRFFF